MTSIRVYRADLGRLSATACFPLLDEAEQQRACSMSNRDARNEFVKSRALLRVLLAQYTGLPPRDLEIAAGATGKPVLLGLENVHFNVSHSGCVAFIAISAEEVGIDIERIDARVDYWGVAQCVFSRSEIETLHDAEGQLDHAFFSIWTRKEAYLKATGLGFSSNLSAISTASPQGLIGHLGGDASGYAWRAFDLLAPVGFKAALVTASRDIEIDVVDVDGLPELSAHYETHARAEFKRAHPAA